MGLTAAECGARLGISKSAWMQLVHSGRAPRAALEINHGAGLRIHRRWLLRQLEEYENALLGKRSVSGANEPCIRCGHQGLGVEDHHWAPRSIFGDAEEWGTVRLGKTCHHKWHRKMRLAASAEAA